uniref:Uncharacterized protein n=1 Tax=Anguilla anguilla TaxID=7936 RepID=A0A0E9WN46_ANGAN
MVLLFPQLVKPRVGIYLLSHSRNNVLPDIHQEVHIPESPLPKWKLLFGVLAGPDPTQCFWGETVCC